MKQFLSGTIDEVLVFDHARGGEQICSDGGGIWTDSTCHYS